MNRLVDYFVILGYDSNKQGGSYGGTGKVLQRFPEHDWPDVPFIEGLELFCQPQGWRLSSTQHKPSFFISVLTDIDANKHYCACLSFYEHVSIQTLKPPDEEDIDMDTNVLLENSGSNSLPEATMYAPKCLVLVSRHHFVQVFKCCLGTIYTVFLECMDIPLETLITNLLCIDVPQPGAQIKFSIGANDKQSITMPLSSSVPVTGTTVAQLFERLGIHNVMSLFTAVMTDHKILFQSKSYSLLHESCHALTSLMYPFVYSHVYIPLLPSSLLEVLSSPTPFIMGVHSSLRNEVEDSLDVIVVDLDGGFIKIPDSHLPQLDGPAYNEMVDQLCSAITPQLMHKDDAFVSSHLKPSSLPLLDKEIRAIFLRLFAQMLQGYRTCLQIVRIHAKPFITFHKASFLGKRNLVENEFIVRLLESMFFNSFVQERGTPYRASDLFDELYATMHDTLKREMADPELVIKDIKELAHQLYINENPHPRESSPVKVPQPTEGSFSRIHQPKFPLLRSEVIRENLENERVKRDMLNLKPLSVKLASEARIIATGPIISVHNNNSPLFTNSARRLEVMKNCINCIFEGKIQDARKSFPAVLRALKNKSERLALAKELAGHVSGNKCVLSHEQFDLVVRLMNCALQQNCDYSDKTPSGLRLRGLGDVNGLGEEILPLSVTFCRRLCTGVIQFAYTCLQEHLIWDNMSFWESTFYQNVEQEIVSLYGSVSDTSLTPLDIAAEQIRLSPKLDSELIRRYSSSEESTVYSQAVDFVHRIVYLKIPLDIASHHEKNTRSKPHLNSSANDGVHTVTGQSDSNSNITGPGVTAAGGGVNGHAPTARGSFRDDHEKENRDFDNESGYEEGSNGKGQTAVSEISVNVIKFTGRFVDKVCTEGGVTEEHIKALHQMIPGIVAMHCETLDAIYKESKKIPPVTKPKIITPNLLPGEELVVRGLRAYLIPDGRDEVLGSYINGSTVSNTPQPIGGPVLLPAEGAVFLTNYRVIFRGRPCDQYASENVIVRSFPIATLVKEKKVNISSKYLIETIDQCISEGLQLRSNICELMKIAFDEEVSSEDIELLRKTINKARTPPNVFHYFAFSSQQTVYDQLNLHNLQKQKEKKSTFKGMAKKTLMRGVQMTGLPIKSKSKKNKYALPTMMGNHLGSKTLANVGRQSSAVDSLDDQSVSDNLSLNSDSSHLHSALTLPPKVTSSNVPASVGVHSHLSPANKKDSQTLKQLTELSYVKDYQRNGLGLCKDILQSPTFRMMSSTSSKVFRTDGFRITTVNCSYGVSASYPAFIAIPACITDDSIQRLSRYYKNCRFPAIVWRHPKTRGLLIRASSFHGKGVIGILKGHGTGANVNTSLAGSHSNHNSHSSNTVPSTTYESSSNVDQEKYFQAIVNLTPHYSPQSNCHILNASLSISSLVSSKHNNDCINNSSSSPSTSPQPITSATIHSLTKDPKKATVMASFSRAMNTIRSSGGKPTFGSIGSSVSKQLAKLNTGNAKVVENLDCENQSVISSNASSSSAASFTLTPRKPSSAINAAATSTTPTTTTENPDINAQTCSLTRKSVYVFGEKSQLKGLKSDLLPSNIEFIPIECHKVGSVKHSFKKLLKACCPSSASTDPEQCFLKQVENSEWLLQLQTIMRISSAIIDLIDLQGSSVMLCLDDDMDLIPQIVSIAELCLDPYYRTFEGFRVLIEKEWLAFGHRFSHRCNHTAASIGSGFAPLFLQFLDIVHQIMHQFPLSFQFNSYYLRFIAYHYVSCRFRTFLLDNEAERAKYGWPLEDIHKNYQDCLDDGYECDIDDDVSTNESTACGSSNGTLTCQAVNGYINVKSSSFWDYAEKLWRKSPIFYNFYYIPANHTFSEANMCVIRPYCNISNLLIWDYYLDEQLNHGPSYDFEVVQMEKQRREEVEATSEGDKDKSKRTIIDASHDCITHWQPASFEEMLEKIQSMEMELGKSTNREKWHDIWDRLDIPVIFSSNAPKTNSSDIMNRQGSIKSQILGRYCPAQPQSHKKNTLDLRKLFPKRLKHKSNHHKLNSDILNEL